MKYKSLLFNVFCVKGQYCENHQNHVDAQSTKSLLGLTQTYPCSKADGSNNMALEGTERGIKEIACMTHDTP